MFNHEAFRRTFYGTFWIAEIIIKELILTGFFFFFLPFIKSQMFPWLWEKKEKKKDGLNLMIRTLLWVLRIKSLSSGSRSLHAWAMLIAVSCLSPVSIQILMPAFWRASIDSGTPSCRRSSMPVAPKKQPRCNRVCEKPKPVEAHLAWNCTVSWTTGTVPVASRDSKKCKDPDQNHTQSTILGGKP